MSKRGKPEPVHTEPHTRGSITFEIRVISEEGCLWGEWTCKACSVDGASSVAEQDVKLAVLSAKINLGGHYATTHADDAGNGESEARKRPS